MKYISILILSSLFLFSQCSKEDKKDPEFTNKDKTYKLVWEDNFDTNGSPDNTKWGNEYGFVRGEENGYYTDRAKNIRVENGYLIIESHKEKIKNEAFTNKNDSNWMFNRDTAQYTSASLTSRDKVSWKYGKIEVSAKLPKGRGIWPAIWMLGDNIGQVGWPKCGEIDIMEYVGFQPSKIHGTIHTKAFNHTNGTQKGSSITLNKPYEDFHLYSIEWTDKKIDILLDNEVYLTFENEHKTTDEWPFNQKFFMILNVAVGGKWGGQQGIDDSIFPQRMEVDYVKVFQLKY